MKFKFTINLKIGLSTIRNSKRSSNEELLTSLLASLECAVRSTHRSPKLYFALYQLAERPTPLARLRYAALTKRKLRAGDGRNNFCIELAAAK